MSRSRAPKTCRWFAKGSPIPMKTMFVSRCGVVSGSFAASRRAHTAWAAISPAVRLFCSPIWPVAQNVHPIAQPACDDTQTVTPIGVAHEHGLDHVLTAELEQRLARRTTVGCPFVQDLDPERELGGQPFADIGANVGHLVVGDGPGPELSPYLLGPERRLAPRDEAVGELFEREVVDGRHDSSLDGTCGDPTAAHP